MATIDHSTVNVDGVINFNGFIGAGVRIGRGVGANGLLTLQNGAVDQYQQYHRQRQRHPGRNGFARGRDGHAEHVGGSTINFTGLGRKRVATGGRRRRHGLHDDDRRQHRQRRRDRRCERGRQRRWQQGHAHVGSGSSITGNTVGIGGNSDTVAGGIGSVVVTDAGSVLNASGDSGFVASVATVRGRSSVTDQATIAATIINVGRADGGIGTLTVDNAAINLSGQQATGVLLAGAGIAIGSAAAPDLRRSATAASSTITNPGSAGVGLNVGGSPAQPAGGIGTAHREQLDRSTSPPRLGWRRYESATTEVAPRPSPPAR